MSQAAKAQEPSMEEILASIRRIIADDDAGKAKPAEAARTSRAPSAAPAAAQQNSIPAPSFAPVQAEPDPAEDVLDLTSAMEVGEAMPAGFQTISPNQDLVFEDAPIPEPELPQPEPMMEASQPEPPSMIEMARRQFERDTGDDRSLLASSTSAAVDSAFNSLAQTVLVQNSRTLDDMVREMLRPMLKTWLDDNLPNMVERMVRAEIERVSRGHG
jgi:cell pole-organizing protein PopZ